MSTSERTAEHLEAGLTASESSLAFSTEPELTYELSTSVENTEGVEPSNSEEYYELHLNNGRHLAVGAIFNLNNVRQLLSVLNNFDGGSAETTVEKNSAEKNSAESTSSERTSAEATGAEATSAEATGAEATSAEATGAEATSAEVASTEATSAEATSAEATSAEATSAEATSAEATSAER